MTNVAALTFIAGALALGLASASASAADVRGSVDTSVKVGAVIQKNTGIANRNEVHLGSVSGKGGLGGDFKSHVKVGAVIQKNTGIANRNRISIGSVSN
ncbi:MAG: hypothetical protein R3228_05680 [Halioglobus sp.]|nr:hypothetical protein [Halioglobus sp.]